MKRSRRKRILTLAGDLYLLAIAAALTIIPAPIFYFLVPYVFRQKFVDQMTERYASLGMLITVATGAAVIIVPLLFFYAAFELVQVVRRQR